MEIGKLMRPKLQKHGGLKLAGRMNETQILQTQCRYICKLNSSREAVGNIHVIVNIFTFL